MKARIAGLLALFGVCVANAQSQMMAEVLQPQIDQC